MSNLEEKHLLNTMQDIISNGHVQQNRTSIPTRSVFGRMFEYQMIQQVDPKSNEPMYRIPMLTTKKMFLRGIFEELMWFLNGRVDAKELQAKKVRIWDGNTSREYLDRVGLTEYEEGETGPIYGFQWRHWGAEYVSGKKEYNREGLDQVAQTVYSLKTDPFSRRHIISGWNVADLDKMCLPPCFIAGSKVLTDRGYVAIEELQDIDKVYTHKGNWKPIINRQKRSYAKDLYKITHGANINPIICTEEHPFLVKRYLSHDSPSWMAAKDIVPTEHLICIPIERMQGPPSITITFEGKFLIPKELNYERMGGFVAMPYGFKEHSGWEILSQFRDSTHTLIIPEWLQRSQIHDLHMFIYGFESSAASPYASCFHVENMECALSLQRIYAKLGIASRVSLDIDNPVIIKQSTNIGVGRYSDGHYLYMPIMDVSRHREEEAIDVYNIEVADDNSYVVQNVATHNCHVLYQFLVHEEHGQKHLSLMMTQRSCDTFLGLPFNICSLGLFLALMAKTVDMIPHKIIHSIADMHIYENHIDAAQSQIAREPYPFPYIRVIRKKAAIEDYTLDDIEIIGYQSHSAIKAPMVA